MINAKPASYRTLSVLSSLLLITLYAGALFAQDKGKEVVEYDFEEDVIDGSTKSPEELYINSLKKKKINTLITIRKDFKGEIIKSAEGI
jgi:hypothetical protein